MTETLDLNEQAKSLFAEMESGGNEGAASLPTAGPTSPRKMDARQALAQLNLADRAVGHAFFQKADEKETKIPTYIKQLFMETGTSRFGQEVRPDHTAKVLTRTDGTLVSRTVREINVERATRKKAVLDSGFSSDNHTPYRALGVPVIDTHELLLRTVQIDVDAVKRENGIDGDGYAKSKETSATSPTKGLLSRPSAKAEMAALAKRRQSKTLDQQSNLPPPADAAAPNASLEPGAKSESTAAPAKEQQEPVNAITDRLVNGYAVIKQQLRMANERVYAVRSGIPFDRACQLTTHLPDKQKEGRKDAAAEVATHSAESTTNSSSNSNLSDHAHVPTDEKPNAPQSRPTVQFGAEGWVDRLAQMQRAYFKHAEDEDGADETSEDEEEASTNIDASALTFKLDPERRAHFLAMYEKNILGHRPPSPPAEENMKGAPLLSIDTKKATAIVPPDATGVQLSNAPTAQDNKEAPADAEDEPASTLYEERMQRARTNFYAQRTLLNSSFEEHLKKAETERMEEFRYRWRAFGSVRVQHPGRTKAVEKKNVFHTFQVDVNQMRHNVHDMKIAARLEKFIRFHDDYQSKYPSANHNETDHNKNGPKHESHLWAKLKSCIERDVPLTKQVFSEFVTSVSRTDFATDESLQRLFRYFKSSVFQLSDKEFREMLNSVNYAMAVAQSPSAETTEERQ